MVGQCTQRIKQERTEPQLGQCGGGLVAELRQPQRSHESEQAAVRHGAGIVGGVGLAAKGESHWLRRGCAGEVIAAVPGADKGQCQQKNKRNTDPEV